MAAADDPALAWVRGVVGAGTPTDPRVRSWRERPDVELGARLATTSRECLSIHIKPLARRRAARARTLRQHVDVDTGLLRGGVCSLARRHAVEGSARVRTNASRCALEVDAPEPVEVVSLALLVPVPRLAKPRANGNRQPPWSESEVEERRSSSWTRGCRAAASMRRPNALLRFQARASRYRPPLVPPGRICDLRLAAAHRGARVSRARR